MKKKGKINPRDVPKAKFISEKRDKVARNNEILKNIESTSDFSKKEYKEEKSPFKREESKKRQDNKDNRDNNYENSQDNTSYSQEKTQDLFKTGEKSTREKIQRKTQERIFEETSSQGDFQPGHSISDYKKSEIKEENRYDEDYRQDEITKETRYGQETDYKLSNFEENYKHRPNFTSPKLDSRGISKNNYKENKYMGWKEEVKRNSFQDRTEKKTRGFKKEEARNFHREESPSYDPLFQDSDNDGVIDRYDMNFRDSNVSYRDTRDDHKYLKKSNFEDSFKATIPKTDRKKIEKFQKNHIGKEEIKEPSNYDPLSQDSDNDGVIDRYDVNFRDSKVSYRDTKDDHKYLRKNWEGISLLGNKSRESFQKNKLKKLYQEEGQFKDKEKKTGLKSSSEKFRNKSLSYKANEEDKKTIQDLSPNKKKTSKYPKDKATIPEGKKLESDSSNGKFRKDSLSKGIKNEVKDDKNKWDKRKFQGKLVKEKETTKVEKDIGKNELLDRDKLDLKHNESPYKDRDKVKKRQGKDTFDKTSKKSNFDPKEEYTRTKKEIKDPKEILEEKKLDGKKESKFHSKKDKKTGKDKFYKKEEKVSKLYEKKSKKEKDLIKDKKKAKKGGLEKPITLASAMTANYLYSGKEDNTGINAAYKLSRTTEIAGRKISHNRRKKPLKTQRKIKSLEGKIHKKESKLLFQRNFEELKKTKAYQNTNRLNRFFMKKRFQRDFKKKQGEGIRKRIKNTFSSLGKKSVEVIRKKGYKGLIIGLCFLGIFIMGFQAMSGMGGISSGLTSNVMATSYLSKEEVLSDVNNEFSSYEYALQDEIDSIKTNYPNYDEYIIKGDSVGHDVHELFSYLTARYGEIKSVGEIQGELKKLFNQMYEKKY
ncbi:MAG: hypothetical protein Q4Q07_08680, partial [Tissierellia bacterium]|nr:hypothetical protein [Tissierellia bacterium]